MLLLGFQFRHKGSCRVRSSSFHSDMPFSGLIVVGDMITAAFMWSSLEITRAQAGKATLRIYWPLAFNWKDS